MAEGIEHHVDKDALGRMERFVDFVGKQQSWFKVFEDEEDDGPSLYFHLRE